MTDHPSTKSAQIVLLRSSRNNNVIKWALGSFAALVACLLILKAWRFYAEGVALEVWLSAAVLAALPVPLYIALATRIDRYEKEPFWMLTASFLWGASISFSIALLAVVLTDDSVDDLLGAVVRAPVVEEGIKGLALFILFWWKRNEFDGIIDGILYAGMVGLGFAMVENYGYFVGAYLGAYGFDKGLFSAFLLFVTRDVFGGFSHSLFTSMTGIGLGLARQSRKAYVKIVAPIAGLLAAMFLHSMWNLSAYRLDPIVYKRFHPSGTLEELVANNLPRLLLITVPGLLVVGVFVFFVLRRERRIIRRHLLPELRNGLLSQQEYDALGAVRGRLRTSFSALRHGGLRGRRAYSRFSQAAIELAFQRDRVQRGITSGDDAEPEAAYIRLLMDAKKHLTA